MTSPCIFEVKYVEGMNIYSGELSREYSKNRANFTATDIEALALLNKCGVSGKDVLDFGCGDGTYSIKFSDLGAHSVTGVDISVAMIELANGNLGTRYKNIKFIEADGSVLPLEDESIDIVFANFVLHHFLDTAKPLSEIYRVLRKGGIFLCTFSAYEVASGAENLANSIVPIRLGHSLNSVLVHNLVKTREEIYNQLRQVGLEIVEYKSVSNPDAHIDPSYIHKDQLKKLTIIALAKKSQ